MKSISLKRNLIISAAHFHPLDNFFLKIPLPIGCGLGGWPWNFLTSELWDHRVSLAQPRSGHPTSYHSQFLTPSLWEKFSPWAMMTIRKRVFGQSVPTLTISFLHLVAQGLTVCIALSSTVSSTNCPNRLLRLPSYFVFANPQPMPKRSLICPEICEIHKMAF